jgi:hypothetical protein
MTFGRRVNRALPGKEIEMPLIVFFVVVNALTRLFVAIARRNREPEPAPMCADCSFAHMQYAVNGRRVISCRFGGGVRPVTINVMYCTDYLNRGAPARVVRVGFVREPGEGTAMAEAASAER